MINCIIFRVPNSKTPMKVFILNNIHYTLCVRHKICRTHVTAYTEVNNNKFALYNFIVMVVNFLWVRKRVGVSPVQVNSCAPTDLSLCVVPTDKGSRIRNRPWTCDAYASRSAAVSAYLRTASEDLVYRKVPQPTQGHRNPAHRWMQSLPISH